MNGDTQVRELSAEEIDQTSGGFIRVYWSEGARALGLQIGGIDIYVGANSAGWSYGDSYGQVRY
jgi:hypothetical protein